MDRQQLLTSNPADVPESPTAEDILEQIQELSDNKKIRVFKKKYNGAYREYLGLHSMLSKALEDQYLLQVANNHLYNEIAAADPVIELSTNDDSYTTINTLTTERDHDNVLEEMIKKQQTSLLKSKESKCLKPEKEQHSKLGTPKLKQLFPASQHSVESSKKETKHKLSGHKKSVPNQSLTKFQKVKLLYRRDHELWKEEYDDLVKIIVRNNKRAMEIQKGVLKIKNKLYDYLNKENILKDEYNLDSDALHQCSDFIFENENSIETLENKIEHFQTREMLNNYTQTDFSYFDKLVLTGFKNTLKELDYKKMKLNILQNLCDSLETEGDLCMQLFEEHDVNPAEIITPEQLEAIEEELRCEKLTSRIQHFEKTSLDIIRSYNLVLNEGILLQPKSSEEMIAVCPQQPSYVSDSSNEKYSDFTESDATND